MVFSPEVADDDVDNPNDDKARAKQPNKEIKSFFKGFRHISMFISFFIVFLHQHNLQIFNIEQKL